MSYRSAQHEEKANVSSVPVFVRLAPSLVKMVGAVARHPIEFIRMMRTARAARNRTSSEGQGRGLAYEIPSYHQGMLHVRSERAYLRATRLCESNAPEVVAMANELGALQVSDWQYAQACFDFLKRRVWFSFSAPLVGALGTLRNGEGICFDKVNLFVALCRAGGIPARYRIYDEAFVQPIYDGLTEDNPIIKAWYDSTGFFIMHTMSEVFLEGRWQPADFAIPPSYEAALGIPLSRLGEEPEGVWNWEVPGSTFRFEEMPLALVLAIRLSLRLVSALGLLPLVTGRWEEGNERGRRILEQIGEAEYDRTVRQTYRAVMPEVSRKLFKALEAADRT